MNNISLLYKIKNGFYCDNCGILRGYPYNDPCHTDCTSVWCIDATVIAHKEQQRERNMEEKEQFQMGCEDKLLHEQSELLEEIVSECEKDDTLEEYEEDVEISFKAPAPPLAKLSIPLMEDERIDEAKFYNGGLREFLKRRVKQALELVKFSKTNE